jgi:hypothetical protein
VQVRIQLEVCVAIQKTSATANNVTQQGCTTRILVTYMHAKLPKADEWHTPLQLLLDLAHRCNDV